MNATAKHIALCIAASVLVGSCAKTHMTSMAAPEAKGRSFARVLVIADIQDLGLRQEAENALARAPGGAQQDMICDPICHVPKGSPANTVFIPAYTVLFPGREYTASELAAVLTANTIDATLVLTPTASGTGEDYIPPSYATTCATWSITASCQTTRSGGVVVEKPWATFTARMFDVRDGKAIWISTSSTGGNAFASASTLIASMASTTLEHLRGDGLVR